ncbi:hypothetical protein [Kineosporia sp. NBRC 101731]|uniref:hypothetical protein n=1 Tax=Kineosporia sp. NBRC 101731 TaxID=3032199 RepID=UPI002554B524|nr:hypothetical protein [Kineosporia sp. NBRC 101731]
MRVTGTVTYTGSLSGSGTLTVAGSGTLVLTQDSSFTRPGSKERLTTYDGGARGGAPMVRAVDVDPPAVIVQKGATLQYGIGSGTGQIANYQTPNGAGERWNLLNTRVDGTLELNISSRVHLGRLSGSGLVIARRDIWPGTSLAGSSSFSGAFYNGTGFDYGSVNWNTALPNLRTVVNQGSAIHSAADGQRIVDRADYWSQAWGNDINFHTWGTGVVQMTGVYSWSDNNSLINPRLSKSSLNTALVAHNNNARGLNLEGATVEFGDGTTSRFFLPGTLAQGSYINLHTRRARSRVILNYNGPTVVNLPFSGGTFHDTLAAVGTGDIVIAATKGNAVTFTVPQNYDGSTTIGKGASLRLGNGTPGEDSSLLASNLYQVINNGTFIVANARTKLSLSKVSGSGSFTKSGAAAVTLVSPTYQGKTTLSRGRLQLVSGTLSHSSSVRLTKKTTLDLSKAGAQTLKNLSAAQGSTIIAGGALNLRSSSTGTVRAGITGAGTVTATGKGNLELLGATISGSLTNNGKITASAAKVKGSYQQTASATLITGGFEVTGPITLAGKLSLAPGASKKAITLIDNTGTGKITGTFAGLKQGAKLNGRTLSYTGGDGNDVTLSATTTLAATSSGTSSPSTAPEAKASVINSTLTSAETKPHVGSIGKGAAGAIVLLALFLVLFHRRGRRRRPSHN